MPTFLKLLLYVSIGTIVMLIPILIQSKWYKVKTIKCLLIAVVLTICGTIGAYIWFFVENHWFGGTSFFGAVFIVPILFIAISILVRVPYGLLIDICAPAECAMLIVMKMQCAIEGCCRGREISVLNINAFTFPSAIVEAINAFVLLVVLILLSRRESMKGKIYPWYFILYGATRFVLNFFREEWAMYDGGMIPFGTVWSVISVIAGVIWLIVLNNKKRKEDTSVPEEVSDSI